MKLLIKLFNKLFKRKNKFEIITNENGDKIVRYHNGTTEGLTKYTPSNNMTVCDINLINSAWYIDRYGNLFTESNEGINNKKL